MNHLTETDELSTIVERLIDAGYPEGIAKIEAQPLARFRSTMARRIGLSLSDFALRFPLPEIAQSSPEQMADGALNQISVERAKYIRMAPKMPADPIFMEAVVNTPGAAITEDGLELDLVRYQKPDQDGDFSVRSGVFYLPAASSAVRHYRKADGNYGGSRKHAGRTLIKRPLFVKGATGGKAPEAAYTVLHGKEALETLQSDIMAVISGGGWRKVSQAEVAQLLERHGADPDMGWSIITKSREGNQLRYAIAENIYAHAVREAGYDAVIGRSVSKGRPVFSEIFDVREIEYPAHGYDSAIHPAFEGGRHVLMQSSADPNERRREFTRHSRVKHKVYHGTSADFDVFDTSKGDLGSHFGTIEQANKACDRGRGIGAGPNIMPVYLDLRNPLRLKDVGSFHADGIALQLARKGWITKAEAKKIVEECDADWRQRQKWDPILRDMITSRGFDGVVYKNTAEGPGDSWIVFRPEQVKSATANTGYYDSLDPNILHQVELASIMEMEPDPIPLQRPRGAIELRPQSGRALISLFAGADRSTFLHEAAHLALAVMQDVARDKPDGDVATDLNILKGWWFEQAHNVANDAIGASSIFVSSQDVKRLLTTGTSGSDEKDRAIDIGMQEHFARAAEAYMMEGQAPSPEMQPIFTRFKNWLTAIYKTLTALDVTINDDVRGVMHRLIVEDAALFEQAAEISEEPLRSAGPGF